QYVYPPSPSNGSPTVGETVFFFFFPSAASHFSLPFHLLSFVLSFFLHCNTISCGSLRGTSTSPYTLPSFVFTRSTCLPLYSRASFARESTTLPLSLPDDHHFIQH